MKQIQPPVKIPVLMYHAVTEANSVAKNPVHVSLDNFNRQMRWLYDENYEAISLHQFYAIIAGLQTSPQKPVLLTFDDGYHSQLSRATPVLNKYGFKAALFLTVNGVATGSYDAVFPNKNDCPPDDRPLTWPELIEMENGLWEIEAHGCHHKRHAGLSEKEIVYELQQAKLTIEKELQKEVNYYAYPYGSYKTFVLNYLVQQGYKAAFAVHPGLANNTHDVRRFHRIEINQNDTLASFIRKTTTGYVSGSQKIISIFRDYVFRSSRLKDAIMMLAGNRVN